MLDAPHVAAPPSPGRTLNAATGTAALLAAGLFATDVWGRPSLEIGVLYVVPLLIGALAGPPRFLPIAGLVASTLTITAGLIGRSSAIAWSYRGMDLVVIWTAVIVLSRARRTSLALQSRTKELADVNYALDQSAILAVTDTRGAITYVNRKFCEISKYSREELLGQDHRILNSGYHPKEYIRTLWTTIASGRIWRGELRNRAKDGSIYWVDTTIVPFLDSRKRPYQYMAIRYEITERKRSEERLREQAALARVGEMAAVVAHEVKNPIAGIRGALQVINSRMAESPDRTIVGDIIIRLDALNGIVQDLLVFAKPHELRLSPVDLRTLIVNTAELLKRDPAFSAVSIEVAGDGASIRADSEQLQLALQNIVMNAAQAMNGAGLVTVTIAPADDGWTVSVVDRGPGMPPGILAKAFDAFFTTKHRGTGLGLPIARRIVEAHSGQLRIESPAGGGTIVSIYLPSNRL